jgi:tRNA(fMet)-specific endonuclease VapC
VNYLLDTDICIYWLNGRLSVKDRLLAVGMKNIAVSVITQAELYYGAYNSSRVEENLSKVDSFFKYISIFPLGEDILKKYGAMKAFLRQSGRPLPDFDLLIACVAMVKDRILVTNNTRHYERIPDLELENWTD